MRTPIQSLTEKLNNNSYFMKRDDLIPFSFGGNKVRKAQLFFKEIEDKEFDCVVTYGSSSSNHCRIVANMAAIEGIPCYIISPNEISKQTSNSKMMLLFGAKVIHCSVKKVKETIERTLNELKEAGLDPYFIEGGGHGNIGTQAYVDAYEEILKFEKINNLCFDYIFHASGTGTTQAGLVCGHLLNNDSKEIVGISNARRNPQGSQVVLESVNRYLQSKSMTPVLKEEINFIDDYVVEGYGSSNREILATIKETIYHEGIPLDATYTGKAYWGMKKYIEANKIVNKNILFIHTGGTPLYFDDLEEILND